MKHIIKKIMMGAALAMPLTFASMNASAQIISANPYLPLWEHLPDGEPRCFEDPDNPGQYRIYIIGSHDVRVSGYCGPDVHAWSAPADDITNWRDEGPIFAYKVDDKFDVMFAPDLVEVPRKDGKKDYYLYPHSCGRGRIGFVAKSVTNKPMGPFEIINATEDGRGTVEGSIFGFDPSVFVEKITDENDPDFKYGFRAYGFWGFQHVDAAQLSQATMFSARKGTDIIRGFIPASQRYGVLKPSEGTNFPHVFPGEDLGTFNFFEAASIRQVGNKYVWVYSGYSGPDYGLGSTNSALRYAYGDSPLGPWKSGGVLVDSRAVVLNEDGSKLVTTYAGHNTHGSIEKVNDQWYCFYHRAPRGFGNARQAMVAPMIIEWDEKSVADGGAVRIRAFDPYARDRKWTCKASNGDEYKGAEVTSEGFNIFGLNPYNYYSAGIACYLSDNNLQQDSWDVWNNHMTVGTLKNNNIVGYKYFGFGGLDEMTKGLFPFDGTAPGNGTMFNLFLTPKTTQAFKVEVWLDGPYDNAVWNGKKLGEINVPANSKQIAQGFTLNVSSVVDNLDKKHAIYLIAKGAEGEGLCDLQGLGFSRKGKKLSMPEIPVLDVVIDGKKVEMPTEPLRSTEENGLMDRCHYLTSVKPKKEGMKAINIRAKSKTQGMKVTVQEPDSTRATYRIVATYHGKNKYYDIKVE